MAELIDFYKQLGLSQEYLNGLLLPKFKEETRLVLADISPDGKERLLTPEASESWKALKSKALADGMTLFTYSAYRSFEFQFQLVRDRIRIGETVEKALCRLTPPGFSEHHSGRAVDIACPSFPHLIQEFDRSVEFRWLQDNASEFGFFMSYPKGNTFGIMYEPWHWCFLG